MDKVFINPPELTKPIGFSYAARTRGVMIYLAGQTAMDARGAIVGAGDIVAQFRQAVANMQIVLRASGATFQDVVKLNFFVTDIAAYQANAKAIGAIYREFFEKHFPAMTLVEVKRLYDEQAMIEIEGVAVIAE
jgi:enamine deaminase RidA (YjgF/YER057c/UK114 family)